MKNKNENIFQENEVQKGIKHRADRLAARLEDLGWENSKENPENELVLKKDCSSCGNKIIERLTKTAILSDRQIEGIEAKSKKPICNTCEEKINSKK